MTGPTIPSERSSPMPMDDPDAIAARPKGPTEAVKLSQKAIDTLARKFAGKAAGLSQQQAALSSAALRPTSAPPAAPPQQAVSSVRTAISGSSTPASAPVTPPPATPGGPPPLHVLLVAAKKGQLDPRQQQFIIDRVKREGLQVTTLDLSGAAWSPADIKSLCAVFPNLQELKLQNCQLTDAHLTELAGFKKLTKLDLGDKGQQDFTLNGFYRLSHLPHLQCKEIVLNSQTLKPMMGIGEVDFLENLEKIFGKGAPERAILERISQFRENPLAQLSVAEKAFCLSAKRVDVSGITFTPEVLRLLPALFPLQADLALGSLLTLEKSNLGAFLNEVNELKTAMITYQSTKNPTHLNTAFNKLLLLGRALQIRPTNVDAEKQKRKELLDFVATQFTDSGIRTTFSEQMKAGFAALRLLLS